MKQQTYRYVFVQALPEISAMQEGVLYVCVEHAVAAHTCMCGCGAEVVTPFSPARWSMTFNGRDVSLHPSVGNWSLPCRAH